MFGAKGISKHWFAAAFAFKVILAFVMLMMYSRNTQVINKADIFRYYEDSKVISQSIITHPSAYFKLMTGIDDLAPELSPYYQGMYNWDYSQGNKLFSNNRLIIRYLALLNVFTFESYFADIVISIFLSFMGLFWIFRFFNSQLINKRWVIFTILFFIPSIAFWTSGILKESLIVFAIGLLLNCGSFALRKRNPIMRTIMVILSLLILYNIKAFAFFVIIPPALAFIWNHFKPSKRTIIPYFIMFFLAFSFASESNKILKTGIFDLLLEKQIGFTDLAIEDNSNSIISPIIFYPTAQSVALNSPIALINSIFRPMPWEAKNIQMFASSIENLVFFLLIIVIIIFPNKNIESPNIFLFGLSFSLAYIIVIGLSTPVLGAISRYRVPALIFLLASLIQLIDIERIKKIIYTQKN